MADVIMFGDAKLKRELGKARNQQGKPCPHNSLTFNSDTESVFCVDCNSSLSGFRAFMVLVRNAEMQEAQLRSREREVQRALESTAHMIAARRVEEAWRCRNTVPACPHCGEGILPGDMLGTVRINKNEVLARREKKSKPNNG